MGHCDAMRGWKRSCCGCGCACASLFRGFWEEVGDCERAAGECERGATTAIVRPRTEECDATGRVTSREGESENSRAQGRTENNVEAGRG